MRSQNGREERFESGERELTVTARIAHFEHRVNLRPVQLCQWTAIKQARLNVGCFLANRTHALPQIQRAAADKRAIHFSAERVPAPDETVAIDVELLEQRAHNIRWQRGLYKIPLVRLHVASTTHEPVRVEHLAQRACERVRCSAAATAAALAQV